jgi:hypothetical protein
MKASTGNLTTDEDAAPQQHTCWTTSGMPYKALLEANQSDVHADAADAVLDGM